MKILKRLIPISIFIILWTIGSMYVSPLFLPAPNKVFESFVMAIQNGTLWKSAATSFIRITAATMLSCAVSIPLGLLVANYEIAKAIVTPLTNLTRFIPVTVFYPLLIMWLGIGETMKISFLFIATFLYFLPTVILCIQETNQDLIDTALTMGMTKFQMMYKVMLPYSLPSIMKSFLMMYGIGWTYVIIVEVVNTNNGLGHLIHIASARGRTDLVFVSVITILIISFLFDNIGQKVIKKVFKWKFVRE